MKFGLTNSDWLLLDKLLIKPMTNHKIKLWVFGSRARGDHKKFSDIDILFSTENTNLPLGFLSQIKESLEESSITIKVDLVKIEELAESYKEQVLKDRIKLNF